MQGAYPERDTGAGAVVAGLYFRFLRAVLNVSLREFAAYNYSKMVFRDVYFFSKVKIPTTINVDYVTFV